MRRSTRRRGLAPIVLAAVALLAAGAATPGAAGAQTIFELRYPTADTEALGETVRAGEAMGVDALAAMLAREGTIELVGPGPVEARVAAFVVDDEWSVERRVVSEPFEIAGGEATVADHLDEAALAGLIGESLPGGSVRVDDFYFPDMVMLHQPSPDMASLAGTAVNILQVDEGTVSVVVLVLPAGAGTGPAITGAAVVAMDRPGTE